MVYNPVIDIFGKPPTKRNIKLFMVGDVIISGELVILAIVFGKIHFATAVIILAIMAAILYFLLFSVPRKLGNKFQFLSVFIYCCLLIALAYIIYLGSGLFRAVFISGGMAIMLAAYLNVAYLYLACND